MDLVAEQMDRPIDGSVGIEADNRIVSNNRLTASKGTWTGVCARQISLTDREGSVCKGGKQLIDSPCHLNLS